MSDTDFEQAMEKAREREQTAHYLDGPLSQEYLDQAADDRLQLALAATEEDA